MNARGGLYKAVYKQGGQGGHRLGWREVVTAPISGGITYHSHPMDGYAMHEEAYAYAYYNSYHTVRKRIEKKTTATAPSRKTCCRFAMEAGHSVAIV